MSDDQSDDTTATVVHADAQRLAALGAITASVAHEINNPAAFLVLGLDLLAKPGQAPPAELLAELKASTLHIVEVVRGLRLLASDTGVVAAGGVSLAASVASGLALVRGRVAEVAEVSVGSLEAPNVAMSPGGALWVVVSALLVAVESIPAAAASPRAIHVEAREVPEHAGHPREAELAVRATVGGPHAHDASASSEAATLALELARATVRDARGSLKLEMPRDPSAPAVEVIVRLPIAG